MPHPESLKRGLPDILPFCGAQRFVFPGFATRATGVSPQDGIEVVRRMGKWIINEVSSPDLSKPVWVR